MGILDKIEIQMKIEHRKFLAYETLIQMGDNPDTRESKDKSGLSMMEIDYMKKNYKRLKKKYINQNQNEKTL